MDIKIEKFDPLVVDDPEEAFRHKVVEELHDIALSLRVMSERNITNNSKKKTYKDMYFSSDE